MKDYNEDRLGKLIAMAKMGYGNEKDIATRKVQALCKKHGLNFDEVMGSSEALKEYGFCWKKAKYERLVGQIVCAYALTKDQPFFENRLRKMIFVNTTQEKYIETLNAIDVLTRLFDKEQKKMKEAFFFGFLEKHSLWNPFPKKSKTNNDLSEEEMKARMVGSALASNMETAEIHKRLK